MSWILLTIKIPFVFLLVVFLCLLNLLKYLVVIPVLVRVVERISNYCLMRLFMQAFSVNSTKAAYHPDHKDFDFM